MPLLVAVTMIAACGSDSGGSGSASTGAARRISPSSAASTGADPLDGTTWTLDVAGLEVPGAEPVVPTISFAQFERVRLEWLQQLQRAATPSPVTTLTIGPLASTQKACGPVETAVETAVLTRLGKVAGFTVAADKLTLTDASGATLLTYSAAKGGVEGSWDANGYLIPAKQPSRRRSSARR